MVDIITVHSARGGTGQSTIIANLATLLAAHEKRVGVIDADLQRLSMPFLFDMLETNILHTFNDYLLGLCDGTQAAYDVTPPLYKPTPGRVFLVPASNNPEALNQVLHEGYTIELITDGLRELAHQLDLDVLLIDTHAGLSEQTLLAILSIAIADTLMVVLRLDQGDYQGTGVTVDVARTLEVPEIVLLVNQVASVFNRDDVKQQVAETYHCDVAAVLPYADEFMLLRPAEFFVLRYPDHLITQTLRLLSFRLSH